MAKFISRWKKSIKNNLTPFQRTQNRYRELWETLPLEENTVLIESQQGRSPFGNMFYIARELSSSTDYGNLTIYYAANDSKIKHFVQAFEDAGITDICILPRSNPQYIKLLASAKYLITDTAWPLYYVKKPGQILLNTWHGTPLKAMGRSDHDEAYCIGNIQRNFINSDFILFPSEYMREHMVKDYMLENICDATLLLGGYPRNTVFFEGGLPEEVSKLYNPEGKRLYAYMPTWRSRPQYPARYIGYELMSYLVQIDSRLQDDEIMYVSIHPLARKGINFSRLKHIEPFPENIETYRFLSMCDVLVTDYSSVLFDFAITRKKIVLFTYDKDIYYNQRGMYLDVDELPFPQVLDSMSLMDEIRSPKAYDDREFLDIFCNYESPDATKKLCYRVFLDEVTIPEEYIAHNEKKNILVYVGNLAKNGITGSLTSLMQYWGNEYNYYLTFESHHVQRNRRYLSTVPEQINFIPCMGSLTLNVRERFYQYRYGKRRKSIAQFTKQCRDAYVFDNKRLFCDIPFSHVIQFTGYDYKKIYALSLFDTNRIIFAHANMVEEFKKGSSRRDITEYAYHTYDKIAVVSEGIINAIASVAGEEADIVVVPNTFNYKRVKEMAQEPIEFNDNTTANVTLQELCNRLDQAERTVVCIGRFSPEKQHSMLIEAFNNLWSKWPESHLVIIGGQSAIDLFDETSELVDSLPCSDSISLIRSVDNPYAILSKANGLILPSAHEGFGLVLLEADALGKPVVSTDIDGPRAFMQANGGCLVENSLIGVQEGLEKLLLGEIKPLNVDYEAYNSYALKQFYSLLD